MFGVLQGEEAKMRDTPIVIGESKLFQGFNHDIDV